LGIIDSKLLTPNKRQRLSYAIKRVALKYSLLTFQPSEIDRVVLKGKRLHKLNWLEAKAMAKIISSLKPEIAYIDAADVNEIRFGKQIREMLPFEINIISEHKADVKYAVVSAASILAKVHRDEAINKLRARYGDLGSGYSSDLKTRQFLTHWVAERNSLPDFVRKSWKTVQRIRDEVQQRHLDNNTYK
jgi:ribonuclease HII